MWLIAENVLGRFGFSMWHCVLEGNGSMHWLFIAGWSRKVPLKIITPACSFPPFLVGKYVRANSRTHITLPPHPCVSKKCGHVLRSINTVILGYHLIPSSSLNFLYCLKSIFFILNFFISLLVHIRIQARSHVLVVTSPNPEQYSLGGHTFMSIYREEG